MTETNFPDGPETEFSKYAPAMLRIFFNIVSTWGLTDSEKLSFLAIDSQTALQQWKAGQVTKIDHVTYQRVLHTIAIFWALNTIFPLPDRADAWMRRPNTAPGFHGLSAIDVVTAQPLGGLEFIRQYLEAQIG